MQRMAGCQSGGVPEKGGWGWEENTSSSHSVPPKAVNSFSAVRSAWYTGSHSSGTVAGWGEGREAAVGGLARAEGKRGKGGTEEEEEEEEGEKL